MTETETPTVTETSTETPTVTETSTETPTVTETSTAAASNTFGLPAASVALIESNFGTVANYLRMRRQGQV